MMALKAIAIDFFRLLVALSLVIKLLILPLLCWLCAEQISTMTTTPRGPVEWQPGRQSLALSVFSHPCYLPASYSIEMAEKKLGEGGCFESLFLGAQHGPQQKQELVSFARGMPPLGIDRHLYGPWHDENALAPIAGPAATVSNLEPPSIRLREFHLESSTVCAEAV